MLAAAYSPASTTRSTVCTVGTVTCLMTGTSTTCFTTGVDAWHSKYLQNINLLTAMAFKSISSVLISQSRCVIVCDRYILVLRTSFERGLLERFDDGNLWCQQHVLCSSEQPQIHHSCDIATCFRWNAVAYSSRTSTPRSIFSTTSQDTSSEKWKKNDIKCQPCQQSQVHHGLSEVGTGTWRCRWTGTWTCLSTNSWQTGDDWCQATKVSTLGKLQMTRVDLQFPKPICSAWTRP